MGKVARSVADFLKSHKEEVLEKLNAAIASEHKAHAESYLLPWLEAHLAAAEGRQPDRTNQWVSLLVENLEDSDAGPSEAVQYVHAFRKILWELCRGRMNDVSEADLALWLTEQAERYQARIADHYVQRIREASASERRRLRAMAETLDDPFITVDVDCRVTMANTTFSQVIDIPNQDAMGQDFLKFLDEDIAQEIRRAVRHKSPTPRSFTGGLRNRRGQADAARFQVQPLFDDSGLRDGAAVLMELRNTARLGPDEYLNHINTSIIALIPNPTQVINRNGRVVFRNASCRPESLGVDPASPICCKLLPKEAGDACPCSMVFETGMPYMEEREVGSGDEKRWFRVVLFPLRPLEGPVERVVCSLRDITQQRKRVSMLERQVLQHQRNSLTSQLAVTVAHQLRNPLSVMVGFAEMLEKGLPPEQVPNAVDRLLRNSIRCKEIVEDLLEFGQGFPGERIATDLNGLVRELVQPAFVPGRDVRVDWRLENEPLLVECIPNQLAQVLLSLLENAVQAAEKAVCFMVEREGEYARLRVCDDGPGVPPALREQIFEPFFTTQRDRGAVGLGLSLSQAVLEEYGGNIRLEDMDSPQWNTCFVAELPRLQTLAHASSLDRSEPPEKRNRHILVVDDESDLIEMLAMLLEMEGYTVATCQTAHLAMDQLHHETFDAVVLDVQLPGDMNGPQFYEYLASQVPLLAERTLFITADTMSYETRRFLERTQRPSMEKPFRVDEFLAAIEELLAEESKDARTRL